MTRTKSILLSGAALAIFAAPQVAYAQSVDATALTLLGPPTEASANNDIFPDSIIQSQGITADGLTVLTSSSTPSGSPNEAARNLDQNIFTWTNGVMRTISVVHPTPAIGRGNGYSSTGISGDGTTIIGSRAVIANRLGGGTSSYSAATIWTQTSGLQFFASPSVNEFVLFAQPNMDGSQIAVTARQTPLLADGSANPARFAPRTVYRYSPTGGYQSLGSLGPTVSMTSQAMSGSGDVIAGGSTDLAASNLDVNGDPISHGAWRWTAASGLSILPDLSALPSNGTVGRNTSVGGISRNGSTIVGGSIGGDGRRQAVYWRNGTITGLGFLPGFAAPAVGDFGTQASAVSADGSVIVGTAGTGASNFVGWHWTAASGMQDLNVLANNAGLNRNGFILTDTTGISDNGQFITGNAIRGGFDEFGLPSVGQGYVLSIVVAPPPTSISTTARLIVTLTLPGVTQTSIVNQSFSTQVDGVLNDRSVFTRTVGDQITGAAGITALADARTALQAGGGLRRAQINAPVLLSSTTTVVGSTSNTLNVASGTQVTMATVITNGPATVATGDLGTCATAAANGVNPTGCSLSGTPVTVNTNVTNTNSFTNTINSVTPTTTQTVDQLVSARWVVTATAGNQFGTVHALVGPVAFERGDRLTMQLLGNRRAANDDMTRAPMPVDDEAQLSGSGGLSIFGGAYGSWSSIDADARVPVANVKGSTTGFSLGVEKEIGAGHVGTALDYGTSDYTVRDPLYPETLTFNQTQVAVFGGYADGGFSLNGAVVYGFGAAKTALNTPTSAATASRDVQSWSLGAQAGYTVPLGQEANLLLVGGVRHNSVRMDGFTEIGGPTPLMGPKQTVTRTRAFGGVELEATTRAGGVTLIPRAHVRVASDSGDYSGTADLLFAGTPNGPVMQAVGPRVGSTTIEIGGILDADVGDAIDVWIGYNGSFREGSQSHAAKAGLRYKF